MPIKNFRVREKLKPLVEVSIGAIVPKGCKKQSHLIYAESPDNNKCVNEIEGECPFLRKEKTVWKKDGKAMFCPMGGLSEPELKDKGFKTRPIQRGYFSMPEEYRVQLGLPTRPTEIPNICLISDHQVEQHGLIEPLECLYRYPVFDYYLAWWTYSACVCKGDGEIAHRYPYSPSENDHMKQRACAYKACPDFDGKYKCKTVGELYFRLPNTPGYPGLWRVATRSPNAIEHIIMELEQLHTALSGVVSRVPLKLSLEEETARPVVNGKQYKTKVHRLHIRTDITMEQVAGFKKAIAKQIVAGDELKQLVSVTPDTPPPSSKPVEMDATASADEWDDESVDTAAEKPAAVKQPAPEKKVEDKPTADSEPKKEVEQPEPVVDPLEEANAIEDAVLKEMNGCKNMDELTAVMQKRKSSFVPFKEHGFEPIRAKKLYKELKKKFSEPVSGPVEEKPEPEKSAPANEPKAGGAGGAGDEEAIMRKKIIGWSQDEPPTIDEVAAVDMINNRRVKFGPKEKAAQISDFNKEELKAIIDLIEE